MQTCLWSIACIYLMQSMYQMCHAWMVTWSMLVACTHSTAANCAHNCQLFEMKNKDLMWGNDREVPRTRRHRCYVIVSFPQWGPEQSCGQKWIWCIFWLLKGNANSDFAVLKKAEFYNSGLAWRESVKKAGKFCQKQEGWQLYVQMSTLYMQVSTSTNSWYKYKYRESKQW